MKRGRRGILGRAHDLRGRDRLRSVCLPTDALLDALALRGENLGDQTSRLLQLLDHYGAVELDRAIAEALTRGTPSAASVAHVLDQRARVRHALPPLDTMLPDDPRVRDLRVTPHALARYDELDDAADGATQGDGPPPHFADEESAS